MSPQLLEAVERARREPEGRFHSLAHRIDVPALERAYHRMREDGAVGVDGVTNEAYGRDLEANLRDLHARVKAKRYRHQPIRRVRIPKEGGKTRPIGVSAFEDKLVQDCDDFVIGFEHEDDARRVMPVLCSTRGYLLARSGALPSRASGFVHQ